LSSLNQTLPSESGAARRVLEKEAKRITFQNWGRTVTVGNVLAFYPNTITQIQKIIKLAAAAGMKVRFCGSTHSWSHLYADSGQILIDPQHLGPKEEKVRLNADKTQVTIMSNATTLELKEKQLKEKFNFMFNVVLDSVTYGGTVSVGCHGVGKDCPALPDRVAELQVVNDRGELVTYNKANKGAAFMRAVTTNLGLFGFVYKMTMNVCPQENIVETTNAFYTVSDTISDPTKLKALVEENWSTELFWFPYNSLTLNLDPKNSPSEQQLNVLPIRQKLFEWDPLRDKCWLRLVNFKQGGEPEGKLFYLKERVTQFFQAIAMKSITKFFADHPTYNPVLCWIGHKVLEFFEEERIVQELPHAIHYRKHIDLAPVYDMEFSFVVDDDYANISQASMVVVEKIKELARDSKFPMNVCFEMRFMGQSNSLLCPAIVGQHSPNESFKTAYLEVLTLVDTPGWKEFCTDIATEWCKIGGKKNVKPLINWGKEMESVPDLTTFLWESNGSNMKEFLKQLGSAVDMEKKLFFNEFLDGIFFPKTKPTPD
jgi:hypothetical protein